MQHTLFNHLLCATCKWGLCTYAGDLHEVAKHFYSSLGSTQRTLVFIALSFTASLPIWFAVYVGNSTFRPAKQGVLLHSHYMRTVGLSVAAAQSATLLCVDWASAFYILVLVVPLLSFLPMSRTSLFQRVVHVCYCACCAMLICYACVHVLTSSKFASSFQNMQSQALGSKSSFGQVMTSWHTTCFSAWLTILLPAYLTRCV